MPYSLHHRKSTKEMPSILSLFSTIVSEILLIYTDVLIMILFCRSNLLELRRECMKHTLPSCTSLRYTLIFFIWISPWCIWLACITTSRNSSHSLMLSQIGNETECVSFDLRPSDAINIAVRCKVLCVFHSFCWLHQYTQCQSLLDWVKVLVFLKFPVEKSPKNVDINGLSHLV
jgi:hypothetical protein